MTDAPASPALPPLREVIAAHGLSAQKRLGQNFLFDLNLTGRIARSAGDLTQGTVIEVGPGPGGLTRALLDAGAAHVVAIERDPRCLPIQAEIAAAYPGRLEVIEGDALEVAAHEIGPGPRRVVANLPYNVATPLILGWLRHATAFETIVVMLQKEVVDRLAAVPRTKDYGRLSVVTQWLCTVEPLFDVNPRAFTPPPKVTSTVVRLTPRPQPLAPCPFAALEAVTAAAFNQRRKMLRASLKSIATAAGFPSAEELCAAANVSPTARAEELSVVDFCILGSTLAPFK
ncbi:16S rRNA (adenine(1518)-N(6)/adenine(1519)-N(6))-dimethyltransferase RsmA [Novispirillum sp. DQ9]|uniref:16S rRNA (adenine(1518)-N(6)/adenine(1519)-N(6))- dimethyltransferase RsmA n=1 Tax=Novispirillum sp. DQ9 TaxID=3398612 RepID=UPI003C7BD912